jgi:hypothetical protein
LRFFGLRLLAIVMFALLWITTFGHYDVCLCLFYGFEKQTSQWPKAVKQTKANITMAKSHKPNKGKHYNGKKPQPKQRRHCDVCVSLVYGFWPL